MSANIDTRQGTIPEAMDTSETVPRYIAKQHSNTTNTMLRDRAKQHSNTSNTIPPNKAQKRSFVDDCLEEVKESSPTKKSTRMELARAKNRRDTIYQNMIKGKERVKKQFEKLRELEASHEAAKNDVERLDCLLGQDD